MNAKSLSYLSTVAAILVLSACATAPVNREVAEAARTAVLEAMHRHWVFANERDYRQESAIVVPAPEPGNPDQMLSYRQASSRDVLFASESEGRVAARWELKENAGSAFPLRQSNRSTGTVPPEPAVQEYLVTFKEVPGGMEIAISISSPDGTEADRMYYTRFWQFMTGRWE